VNEENKLRLEEAQFGKENQTRVIVITISESAETIKLEIEVGFKELNNNVVLLKNWLQELKNELEDLKEKIEFTGIERDNLLQEFRDIIVKNMNVIRIKMESGFRKLNMMGIELEECGVQELKADLEVLKGNLNNIGVSQRDKWNEWNKKFDIEMNK
jgi:hypothetical protein